MQLKNGKGNLAALNDFTMSIALTPSSTNAYIQRANIYLVFGDYRQATRDIETACSLNPESKDLIKFQYQVYMWASEGLFKKWNYWEGIQLYIKKCQLYQKLKQEKIKIPERIISQ